MFFISENIKLFIYYYYFPLLEHSIRRENYIQKKIRRENKKNVINEINK